MLTFIKVELIQQPILFVPIGIRLLLFIAIKNIVEYLYHNQIQTVWYYHCDCIVAIISSFKPLL